MTLSNRLALKTGRTKAFYLREMIESGIAEMEEYYLTADTLKRVRQGREMAYSAAAVRKDLGLDDIKPTEADARLQFRRSG
jgi:RHH-type rel operon transcriptional repressor/antitoxin RelB